MKKLIDIPDDWYQHLRETIESPYFRSLGGFIAKERASKQIFPKRDEVFRAFNLTPFQKVRVVILGMDPYPNKHKGEPVACGLSFAPRNRDYIPPSLRIMYNRIKQDIYPDELSFPIDMNIESWAKQGVLMLNAALTIEEGKSGSHLEPWKQFTEEVLKTLSSSTTGLIFCFWGKDALKFAHLVDDKFHHVLTASHPASALYKGGEWECDHFTRINQILMASNPDDIVWLENLK
jgi:uracil-DNA glycosylase